MRIKSILIFVSCFFINNVQAMNGLTPLMKSPNESQYRFFLVPQNPRLASCEVPLDSVTYDNEYEIYDRLGQCYGKFICLVPYLFMLTSDDQPTGSRFLHVQTGEYFDVLPLHNGKFLFLNIL